MKSKILIVLIVVLATLLRLGWFGDSPPALNWDEASLGYSAYSILRTGKDEWGRFLPLTFEAFGDYKLPGYIYTTVPFIFLFDLNEFSVRLPSALAGVMSVFLIYLITKQIFDSKIIGFIASVLFSVSPWAVFLSRAALEANLSLGFFLAGVYFLLLGRRNMARLSLSAVFFGLTLFTYNSARVFVPLFLTGLVIFNFTKIKSKIGSFITPGFIFLIFFASSSFLALTSDSASRYYWVAILDDGAINQINQLQGSRQFGSLTRYIYNKYSYFTSHFITNYLSHFSPQFLFFEGGSNYQFSVPKTGLLYLIELPFLIYGVFALSKSKKEFIFLMSWILLSPIPASITRESPHVLRGIFMLGGLQIVTAFGFVKIFEKLEKKSKRIKLALLCGAGLLLSGSVINYFNNYFIFYPKKYSASWQYGYRQALDYLNTKPNLNLRPIFITKKYGEPHIYYLFYNKYDPAKYQNNPSIVRYERSNWRWIDKLDNVYFINDWEMKERIKDQHGYVVTSPGNYVGVPPILKTIKFLDGNVAFEVVEI